jgi:Cu-Zn family superoxide dismutase
MHRTIFALAALSLATTAGCTTTTQQAGSEIGSAMIADRDGRNVGTTTLYSQADEVTISVSLNGLAAGIHAVHLHTAGNCSADDFTSAGGHLNPAGMQHGSLNPQGAHLGDLPNVEVSSEGAGTVSAILRGPGANIVPDIFDADGTALVVHAGPDDYRSDPAGAAGPRVACGVFSRS